MLFPMLVFHRKKRETRVAKKPGGCLRAAHTGWSDGSGVSESQSARPLGVVGWAGCAGIRRSYAALWRSYITEV